LDVIKEREEKRESLAQKEKKGVTEKNRG